MEPLGLPPCMPPLPLGEGWGEGHHFALLQTFTVFCPTEHAGSNLHRAQFSGMGFVGHTPLMP
jgi:hypothetical protein